MTTLLIIFGLGLLIGGVWGYGIGKMQKEKAAHKHRMLQAVDCPGKPGLSPQTARPLHEIRD